MSPDDLHVIGHQPVSYRTYAASRIFNLVIYISYVILTLNVVPLILGTGLGETTIVFPVLYGLSAVTGSFLASGCIILFYVAASGGKPSTKVQETLAWTQAALMLVTGYGGQAVLRDSKDQLEMAIYHLPDWLQWTPPGLLARFIQSSDHPGEPVLWWIFGVVFTATCVVWYFVYRFLANSYAVLAETGGQHKNQFLPTLKTPGSLWNLEVDRTWSEKRIEQKLGYWFGKFMLFRDASFRMRLWPNFGVPVAFIGIGLFTGELVNPMLVHGKSVGITLTALYSLAIPLPAIYHSMKFSKEHQASWVLGVSPIQFPSEFIRGLQQTVHYWVMLPFVGLVGACLLFSWGSVIDVAIHLIIASFLIVISSSVSTILIFRQLPFSRPLGRGELMGTILPVMSVVSSLAILLGAFHYLASFGYLWMVIYLGCLAAGAFVSRKVAQAKLDQLVNKEWSIERN